MDKDEEGYMIFPVDQSFSDSDVNAGRVEVRKAGYYEETRIEFNYRFKGGKEAKAEFNKLFDDLDTPVDYEVVQSIYQAINEKYFDPISESITDPIGSSRSELARRLQSDTPGVPDPEEETP